MDSIENLDPKQVGALLLNEKGEILKSQGRLDNNSQIAKLILNILQDANSIITLNREKFVRLTITLKNDTYKVIVEDSKIYIILISV
ncbi:ragulator complex protein lamtor4 [Anaeramoeba ignava]|uniref:Late endosomal/lysosomal adaptor and MAPK and MTOR activator 4 n=1 Tax=Anaeramoeba ignava TaxID=1746090 RepID=A0A9Q0LPT7_ANAIG|nr:ragulator complex protein lamtor4 [Anaeramoeba ignava]